MSTEHAKALVEVNDLTSVKARASGQEKLINDGRTAKDQNLFRQISNYLTNLGEQSETANANDVEIKSPFFT